MTAPPPIAAPTSPPIAARGNAVTTPPPIAARGTAA